MKAILALALALTTLTASASDKYPFVPQPAEFTAATGKFAVPQQWKVSSDLSAEATQKLLKVLPQPSETVKSNANLVLATDTSVSPEGYVLEVAPSKVTVKASTDKGFYYGLQSLRQLAPAETGNADIACFTVADYPRFQHRGLMLDASRYFIPKEEVFKMIDVASALKLNKLHMHLTDDNGWRMEIKKYPKLTDMGAWRVVRDTKFPGRVNPTNPGEPTPVGGFYTQDDLREIVAYAADRHMDVIPEIEMPAHAAAAIASYPELACPVVDKFVGVFPGIGGEDASIIMCAGNDSVYTFYQNILDEVMDVFPSEYIHLGGDEADKTIWKQCPKCKERLEKEGLANYEELQGYFMDRINAYVRSKGRTAMGWDEVTYGNPKEDMVILGWQGLGNVAVRDARKTGRKFILTPSKLLYLLRYQGPQWFEPYTYFGNNTLRDVYLYEPVQEDWTPELKSQLLGIQGSMWNEFVNSPSDMEYLLFPRLVAVADGAWRPEGSADWPAFVEAVDTYLPRLEEQGVTYANSMYNIQHTARPVGGAVSVELECERPDVEVRYSFNGSPTPQSTLYTGPIKVNGQATIAANTYKDGKQMGKTLILRLDDNKATGRPVTSGNCNNELQDVLTNGLRGSQRQSDFEWAGWYDRDAEFVVDLGEVQDVKNASLGTVGHTDICIAMPESVEIYGSANGNDYTLLSTVTLPADQIWAKDATLHDIDFGNLDTQARYIKFVAKNPGKIPAGFARSSRPTWVYFDEVTVN